MPKEFIITMAAANRAGILAAVTRAMTELGGDLREASQTVVRGFFTMIFSTEFPDAMDASVVRDHLLDACRPFGIELSVRDPSAHLPVYTAATANTRQYRLRIGGQNQPGILRKLSLVMSLKGIDISGMHAVRMDEGQKFELVMKLAIPQDCPIDSLLHELNDAGREFNVTAELREAGE